MKKFTSSLVGICEIISFFAFYAFIYVKLAFDIYPPSALHWSEWGVPGPGPSASFSISSFFILLLPAVVISIYFFIYRFVIEHTLFIDLDINRRSRRISTIIISVIILAYFGFVVAVGCSHKGCSSTSIVLGLLSTIASVSYFIASMKITWQLIERKFNIVLPTQSPTLLVSISMVVLLLILLVFGIFYFSPSVLDAAKISIDYIANLF